MKITRTSMASGETRTLDLDVTELQLARWRAGEHIQDVVPHLSAADREFIFTGITAEEWNAVFNACDFGKWNGERRRSGLWTLRPDSGGTIAASG